MREHSRPPWSIHFRLEAAKIHLVQGQSEAVIQLLTQNWPANSDPDFTAQRFSLLALAYARKGEPDQARKAIDKATQLASVSASESAEVLAARARLEELENNLSQARSLLQESLETAHASGNSFAEATALLNLSVLNLHEYHYEDALDQAEASARIAKSLDAQVLLEKALGNAGWAYYGVGDYQHALVNFNQAAASAADLGSVIDQEIWNNTAGMSEARLGNLRGAQSHYEKALSLAQSMKNPSEIIDVNYSLASLLLRMGRAEESRPYINRATQLAQQIADVSEIQLGNLLQAQFLATSGDLAESKTLLLRVERKTKPFPTTHLEAQHTLAQVSEKLGNNREAETWYQRSIATYRAQRSQLKTDDARLPFFENGRSLYMDYVAFLIRNHRTDDALEIVDQGRAETLAEGLEVKNKRAVASRPASLRQLALRSHAVILVYALSSPASYLWASNGKDSGFYLLPDRAAILAQVTNHQRAVLAARDLVTEQHPAARTLYDMLVKPAEQLIHPGSRVFIVGAGGLSDLNFETLLTPGKSIHYWIEDVTITHFSSLRFLTLPRREPAPGSSRMLIIGNPVYAGGQYSSLPNAATEVKDVASHFPAKARTILTGADATPGAYLRSEPAHFEYIHFVAHATASRLVPLDSAVILSGQETQSPAKLYARDILSRPLDAELVTISACQGSGVRTYAGEGLVGLAWAFLRAGSRNVIGALWDVSDASTPELMQRLYDGIAAGQPPDAALRAAKLQMLHTHGVFRKPLYWGAFQLYSSGQ